MSEAHCSAVGLATAAILLFGPIAQTGAQDVLYEWWNGTGNNVASLTSLPDYPDNPSGSQYLNSFERGDWGVNFFGSRMSGVITAPETGDYTFWITADDSGEVWLSQDRNPGNWVGGAAIAYVGAWAGWDDWEKEVNQQSALIPLEQNKQYYIMALHAEGDSGDHVRVRWQLPSGPIETPIPGNRVTRWYPTLVSIEATDPAASETGPGTGKFTISQVGADALTQVVVNIQRNLGSATEGASQDFTFSPDLSSNTITIPAGETSVVVTVTPVDDTNPEGPEDVTIKVISGEYSIDAPGEATVTIADNDVPGSFNLLTPVDGAVEVNQAGTISLNWENPSPPASGYSLVVADNTRFVSPIVDEPSLPNTSSYNINGGVLSADETYYWKVTATNAAGETAAANNPFSFLTEDTVQPFVARTGPEDGAGDADVASSVKVYFSEAMKPDNMLTAFSMVDSGSVPVTGTSEFSISVLTFTPDNDMDYSETYSCTLVTTGMQDLAGNPIGDTSPYTFSFTTFEELSGWGGGAGCTFGAGAFGLGGACVLAFAAALLRRRARG